MNRSENILLDAFQDTTSLQRREVLDYAEQHDSKQQAKQAYTNLIAKGVLAEDEAGVTTVYRNRAAEYDRLYPLLEPADDDL